MTAAVAVGAIGGRAMWYLTRSSGLVAFALLSATMMIGIVAAVGWTTRRWPRFLSQDVHRNLSLLALVFLGVHIVSTVVDGYVPIGWLDVVLPFRSPYRPLYTGLGALAFDLLLAVMITSGLRHRIGFASWRFVHWLAYLCWPVALVHGLGTGSDTQLPLVLAGEALCAAGVLGAVAWRLVVGSEFPAARRLGAAGGAAVVSAVIAAFAVLGPLRPGWSHRSGTSSALLSQLAARNGTGGSAASAPAPAPAATAPSGTGTTTGVPAAPFRLAATGTRSTARLEGGGVRVTLALHLTDPASTPLTFTLDGAPADGGVALTSGSADLGPYHGPVTGLAGSRVEAQVAGPAPMVIVADLQLSETTDAVTATVTATPAGR